MDLHGGNIYKIEREKNIKKESILDYSSNINPLGVPQNFINNISDLCRSNLELLTKYPDVDYVDLRNKIGEFNNLKLENVVVGNGATEILFLYMRALKPKKVLLFAPCFAEYKRALDSVQAEIHYFELKEEEDYILNTETLLERLKKDTYDLVLLCNPNNPTGKFISLDQLEIIKNYVEENNLNLFIDEAFIEFVEDSTDKTAMLLNSEKIFVMRAFTKFFAIPGLRLGYGLAHNKKLIEKLNNEKEPWSVNSFANLAGLIMLDDKEYIKKTEEWIKEEKNFFYEKLSKFSNLKAYKTECNFILLKLFSISSIDLREKMLEKNILIRDASNFKFLNNRFVRLAIKDRKSNLKVLKALSEIVEEIN